MKMKKLFRFGSKLSAMVFLAVVYPLSAFAQGGDSDCLAIFTSEKRLGTLFQYITCSIGAVVIPLIFGLAIVVFLYGMVQFVILGAGEEQKREQGRQHMIWGIIALTVMIGIWGLVQIVGDTFSLETGFIPQVKP